MPRISLFNTGLDYGEIAEAALPALQLRSGAQLPLKVAENVVPDNRGGLRVRPGTVSLDQGEALYSVVEWPNGNHTVHAFEFDDDERYIVYLIGGNVPGPTAGTIYVRSDKGEIGLFTATDGAFSPFGDVEAVRVTQLGDTMVLTSYEGAKVLKRVALNQWELSDLFGTPDEKVPFLQFHDGTVSLTPSAISGTPTCTTTVDYFDAQMVGTYLRIHGVPAEITTYNNPQSVQVTLSYDLPISQDIQLGASRANDFRMGELVYQDDTGAQGTVHNLFGSTVLVHVVTGAFTNTGNLVGTESRASTTISSVSTVSPLPTFNWQEQAYSSFRGWPSACVFYRNRLWLAGHKDYPPYVTGSRIGLYFDFDTGDGDDNDAISLVVEGHEIGHVQHLHGARNLIIVMDRESGYFPVETLTPAQIRYEEISRFRDANDANPISIDESVLIPNRGGCCAHSVAYDRRIGYVIAEETRYMGGFVSPIRKLTKWQDEQARRDFAVAVTFSGDLYIGWRNDDGFMSWVRWITEGDVLSAVSLGTELYLLTSRVVDVIGDTTENFIEKVSYDHIFDNQITLDLTDTGSERYYSPNPSDIAGINQANAMKNNPAGVEVASVNADGNYGRHDMNTEREVRLPQYIDDAQVICGYPFEARIEPVAPDIVSPYVVTTGQMTQLISFGVKARNTRILELDGIRIINAVGDSGPFSGEEKEYVLASSEQPELVLTNKGNLSMHLETISVTADFE